MLGFPVKLDRTPCQVRLPTPELGQHTPEVLRELGFDEAGQADLRERRII
jgi:crotonobetainyl-CoA:carnitine CoA-transferase CaiB-like acyl-CoA transferase